MTCGACTSAIISELEKSPEISKVDVSLITEEASVEHTSNIAPADIEESIQDCGFDTRLISTTYKKIMKTRIKIGGMTCGACSSSITANVLKMNGVAACDVSLITEEAEVEHNALVVTKDQIMETIEDSGFDAELISSEQASDDDDGDAVIETILDVKGMTCGACTSSIESTVGSNDKVVAIQVSLITEQAIVKHHQSLTSESIKEIIDDCGFDSTIIEVNDNSGPAQFNKDTYSENITLLIDVGDDYNMSDLNGLLGLEGVNSFELVNDFELLVSYNPYRRGIRSIIAFLDQINVHVTVKEVSLFNENLSKLQEIEHWKWNFIITGIIGGPMFVLNHFFPQYDWDLGHGIFLKSVIELIWTTYIQLTIGSKFYENARNSLKHGSGTMDLLIFISTNIAYYFSILTILLNIWRSKEMAPHTLFETSILLINFVSLGKYFETRAKSQTSFALSNLMNLTSSTCSVLDSPEQWNKPNATFSQLAINLIQINDIVEIKPGEKIPADGIIVKGHSEVDESLLTGESIPLAKSVNDKVVGGSINGIGHLLVKVQTTSQNSQLSKIIKVVKSAQLNKAPIQSFADFIASIFVPTVITLSLITFICWLIICHVMKTPPEIFQHGDKVFVCLKIAISVIVVACPCALGLAAPTAVMVGTGVGASNGVLIKGGDVLEKSNELDVLLFDKTGTLTLGEMKVDDYHITGETPELDTETILKFVGKVESRSEHPIGKAITSFVQQTKELTLDHIEVVDFEVKIGEGLVGSLRWNSKTYKVEIGNAKLFHSKGDSFKPVVNSSNTLAYIYINDTYHGHLELQDVLKPDSIAVVEYLQSQMELDICICTGDSYKVAHHIAEQIGIPYENVYAEVSPYGKKELVERFQKEGLRVGFVGDGINDSPALAAADLGIALASKGTDIAIEAADIVVINNELKGVVDAISIADQTLRRIKWNFFWSTVYNMTMLPLAMGVLIPWGIELTPLEAGSSMAFSSVSVVVNSLLLKNWKSPDLKKKTKKSKRRIGVMDDIEMTSGLLRS
ncbi:hypothetical protein WICPIJ_002735 [Wickerhamomyces pijperi]|uniref:P-type Cu(+) transporter n=1 Tax=Wickerhamomyces pijperi TaxID=599730 RepID=A0A9P8TPW5_WICPI|nr:hypothetical protein WICPIJ_002735 [Wickerhamomyces pijperi]